MKNEKTSADFAAVRKEYENTGIDTATLLHDPFAQFRLWVDEATEHCPGRWFEPNGMALATCGADGRVTNRWVLLKGISDDGFKFYTNYDSDKGAQIDANPNVAAAFHWPYLGRQLRIDGVAEKTSRDDSRDYFHSRPRGSQLSAFASAQSRPVPDRATLESQRDQLESELDGGEVPLPERWGGYLIRPNRFEFWQGRLDRLHDRMVYSKGDSNEWAIERLSP